jgi:hypothetical protein
MPTGNDYSVNRVVYALLLLLTGTPTPGTPSSAANSPNPYRGRRRSSLGDLTQSGHAAAATAVAAVTAAAAAVAATTAAVGAAGGAAGSRTSTPRARTSAGIVMYCL